MPETPQGRELFPQARERIQRGIVECGIPSLTLSISTSNNVKRCLLEQ
jgi:hypothetical protein